MSVKLKGKIYSQENGQASNDMDNNKRARYETRSVDVNEMRS